MRSDSTEEVILLNDTKLDLREPNVSWVLIFLHNKLENLKILIKFNDAITICSKKNIPNTYWSIVTQYFSYLCYYWIISNVFVISLVSWHKYVVVKYSFKFMVNSSLNTLLLGYEFQ